MLISAGTLHHLGVEHGEEAVVLLQLLVKRRTEALQGERGDVVRGRQWLREGWTGETIALEETDRCGHVV